jgi:hypothetical protein
VGLARILYDELVMRGRRREDGGMSTSCPVEMDWDHCPRARGQHGRERVEVDVAVALAAVDEHRSRPGLRLDGGDEGVRWDGDLPPAQRRRRSAPGAVRRGAATLLAIGMGVWAFVIATYVSSFIRIATVWLFTQWVPDLRTSSFALWRELAHFARHIVASELLRQIGDILNVALLGRFLGLWPR